MNEKYVPAGAEAVDATGNESDRQQATAQQQQQQQKDSQPIAGEDTRFAMPSDTPLSPVVSPQQMKTMGSDVTYVETGFTNATANDAITQASSEEHELETRLK